MSFGWAVIGSLGSVGESLCHGDGKRRGRTADELRELAAIIEQRALRSCDVEARVRPGCSLRKTETGERRRVFGLSQVPVGDISPGLSGDLCGQVAQRVGVIPRQLLRLAIMPFTRQDRYSCLGVVHPRG